MERGGRCGPGVSRLRANWSWTWRYARCFLFSSRRRHTRFACDWSSDVCSSDLARKRSPSSRPVPSAPELVPIGRVGRPHGLDGSFFVEGPSEREGAFAAGATVYVAEIGRASCRERG